ncbi:sulfotransferase [Terasakiella sp. A23]|uniref:tetratricopeptide repeat-containing sulfotransferase family protein n=1 Tax=Terasakiella sp. FCG-A23 TaxID=3080561 RepID=UPI002953F519|nr:sulfotransferase [Terasakiella sp. A23]MDV7338169.1 sulfotransferase [Terasakiella sp. A23]
MSKQKLEQAKAAIDQKDYGRAESIYRDLLMENSADVDAFLGWAEMAIALSNPQMALDLADQFLSFNPDHVGAFILKGRVLLEAGQFEPAAGFFNHVLKIDPENKDARLHFARLCAHTNNWQAALQLCPNDIDLWFAKGQFHIKQDQVVAAIHAFKEVIARADQHQLAHFHLGHCLGKLGWTHEAVHHLEISRSLNEDHEQTLIDLINAYEKLDYYEKALDLIGNDDDRFIDHRIRLLNWLNRSDDMTAALDHLAARDPIRALNLEKLDPKRRHSDETLANYTQAILQDQEGDKRLKSFALNAIAQFYHRNKNYEQAMTCYHATHAMVRPDETIRLSGHIQNYKECQVDGSDSDCPIFIIGMPRSGTSLLEAMLARHNDVAAAGELIFMMHADKFIEDELSPDLSSFLSEGYLARLEPHRLGKKHVIDKMPLNFQQVGLIATLFPKARFLYTLRDPIATCFSIYQQIFTGHHPYSHDLKNIADYYKDHLELMDFWKGLFDDRIFEVSYEKLVSHPEEHAREILGFLDLDWQDAVLQQSDKTVVRTASSWQVQQEIYTSAIAGWKNYEPWLQDLIDAFQDQDS